MPFCGLRFNEYRGSRGDHRQSWEPAGAQWGCKQPPARSLQWKQRPAKYDTDNVSASLAVAVSFQQIQTQHCCITYKQPEAPILAHICREFCKTGKRAYLLHLLHRLLHILRSLCPDDHGATGHCRLHTGPGRRQTGHGSDAGGQHRGVHAEGHDPRLFVIRMVGKKGKYSICLIGNAVGLLWSLERQF